MRIDSSGNLLVGKTGNLAGARTLVAGTKSGTNGTNGQLVVLDEQGFGTTDNGGGISFGGNFYNGGQVVFATVQGVKANNTDANNAGALKFTTKAHNANQVEAMRIDSSGNLLVNTTSATVVGNGGFAVKPQTGNGTRVDISNDGEAMLLDGAASGPIIGLYGNGTAVGNIGTPSAAELNISAIGTNSSGLLLTSANSVRPMKNGSASDNTQDLGNHIGRWDDIYATNGSIQTSDFNEKQDIASLTATEMLVGARISALFKTFRWKDSVAEKGDNARTHTGVIAQDVQAAFTAEGLDAGDYALFISTTWWETQTDVPAVEAVAEVTDEDGNVTTEAVEAKDAYTRTDTYETEAEAPEGSTERTRLGIRYPELLSFVAAYNEQRFVSIEARLTALEA
tara:strand:- start:399 stop:1586 length:1188 start_codon:yes stop_codon:yes gene_type:complete